MPEAKNEINMCHLRGILFASAEGKKEENNVSVSFYKVLQRLYLSCFVFSACFVFF